MKTKIKNCLSLALSVALCISIAPVKAHAYSTWKIGYPNADDVIASQTGPYTMAIKGTGNTIAKIPWDPQNLTILSIEPTVKPTSLDRWFRSSNTHGELPIPSSVKTMRYTFFGCRSLYTSPSLPDGLENMQNTFSNSELSTHPDIPDSVKYMNQTFGGCDRLLYFKPLPDTVEDMDATYIACSGMRGTIRIPKNVKSMYNTFMGTKYPITMEYWASSSVAANASVPPNVTKVMLDDLLPQIQSVAVDGEAITITATDNVFVSQYGFSETDDSATVQNWQTQNTFSGLAGGKTYYAFAKDKAGNISASYEFAVQDSESPSVTRVRINAEKCNIQIYATDNIGVDNYGYSESDDPATVSKWNHTGIFLSLTGNVPCYAFAQDAAGNFSDPYPFLIEMTDTEAPVVNSVDVINSGIKIIASDNIGISKYGVSTSASPEDVIAWKTSSIFSSLKDNTTYYAFVEDVSGNLSVPYEFIINPITDSEAPVVSRIRINGLNVQVYATDNVAVTEYSLAIEDDYSAVIKRNASGIFTKLTAGSTYYAFARDAEGNVSDSYVFKIPSETLTVEADSSIAPDDGNDTGVAQPEQIETEA